MVVYKWFSLFITLSPYLTAMDITKMKHIIGLSAIALAILSGCSNTATLSSNSSFTAFETKHCFTFLPASDIEHILHVLFWWAMPTMHGVEISVLLHCERLWNIWAESFCILQIPSYPYRTWWDTHNCMSSKIKVREGWAFKKRALKGMYLVDTKTLSCFVSSLILLRSIF